MRTFFFSCLLAAIVCTVQSCNRDCSNTGSHYHPPFASQLNKYSFMPGSFWIYQDSASGLIDSQSVYFYNLQTHYGVGQTYLGNGADCVEYGDVFSMSVASFWNGAPHDSIWFSNNISYIMIGYSSPTTRNNQYAYPALSGDRGTTITNFQVLGQTFPSVYKVQSDFFSGLMYHVDNVGVVKWVFNDTINGQHTWNLVRYHVINP